MAATEPDTNSDNINIPVTTAAENTDSGSGQPLVHSKGDVLVIKQEKCVFALAVVQKDVFENQDCSVRIYHQNIDEPYMFECAESDSTVMLTDVVQKIGSDSLFFSNSSITMEEDIYTDICAICRNEEDIGLDVHFEAIENVEEETYVTQSGRKSKKSANSLYHYY